MDSRFRCESLNSTAYLLNQLPSPILDHKSPFELVYGFKPDYNFLKVFGCACYPYLKPYQRYKISFKTSKCLFIGYCSHHKGCWCLHPSGRIYIAKNVAFDEQSFPYLSMCSSNSSLSSQSTPSNSSSPPLTSPSSFDFPYPSPVSPTSQPSPPSSLSCHVSHCWENPG